MGDYSIIKTPSFYVELTLFSIAYVLNLKSSYRHGVFNTDNMEM